MDVHRQRLLSHPWRAAALWLLGNCVALLLGGNLLILMVLQSVLVFWFLGNAWWFPFTLMGLGTGYAVGTLVFWRVADLQVNQVVEFTAAGAVIGLIVGSMQWIASLFPGSRVSLPGLWWVLASVLGVGVGYPVSWEVFTRVSRALIAATGVAGASVMPGSWIDVLSQSVGFGVGIGLVYGLATATVLYGALTYARRAPSARSQG